MKKLILIIAALALIASPALAVDWNFYGSARMATFYNSRDFGDGDNAAGTDDSDDEVQWALQSNSRLGSTVKAENISGRFEFGINESDVTSRRIYGEWDFGGGKLKVGKDYTPVKQFISGQAFDADLGLLGLGTAYGSRRGQIAMSFGGFEVALIDASTGLINGMSSDKTTDQTVIVTTGGVTVGITVGITNADFTGGDVDEYLPKIEAAWGMSFDTWNFKLNGGFQWYQIEDVVSAAGKNEDVDVTSWTLGADAGVNLGPAYIKGAINFGSNVGNAGWHITKAANGATYDGDDDTDDVDTIMGALVVGFKFTDQLTLEGGVGYREDSGDAKGQDDDDQTSVYVQGVVSLAPGVWLIPEVGYYDLGDDINGDDEGDQFYLGAKWQIDF
jgi:hypothetical protein